MKGETGGFLEAIFGGAMALVRTAEIAVSRLLRVVLIELDRSQIGRAVVEVLRPSKDAVRRAQEIAEEEAELAKKAQQDGRQSDNDRERQEELKSERERVRQEHEQAKIEEEVEKFKNQGDELVAVKADSDEYIATTGLLTLKKNCQNCGAPMTIKHGGLKNERYRDLWWKCTSVRGCPWAPFDPAKDSDVSMIRPRDVDLDLSAVERRKRWNEPKTIDEANGRLRKHMGESDADMLCPYHLVPTKLFPILRPGGALLTSYQYLCVGTRDGKACPYSVPLDTFVQVSTALKRLEGKGILG